MKLYVFNPDTDMALASNEENYMAPASARRMAQDLALLPVWYAQPGSAVLATSAYNADYLQKMKSMFPLSVQLVTEPELPDYAESQIALSASVCRRPVLPNINFLRKQSCASVVCFLPVRMGWLLL